jgi:hypothetical protein
MRSLAAIVLLFLAASQTSDTPDVVADAALTRMESNKGVRT